jgi:hypothetical protein
MIFSHINEKDLFIYKIKIIIYILILNGRTFDGKISSHLYDILLYIYMKAFNKRTLNYMFISQFTGV